MSDAPASTSALSVQDAIGKFLGALGTRNLEATVACYSPDVDWLVPGNTAVAPWVGRRQGLDQVREFYQLLWAATEPLAFDLEHMVFDGNHCIITGQLKSKMTKTGKVFESMFSGHVTVGDDGLITRYRVQEDSWGLVEALTP